MESTLRSCLVGVGEIDGLDGEQVLRVSGRLANARGSAQWSVSG